MFIKQDIADNLIKEADTIRDHISDELKVFICLLNGNGNFLFEIIERYFYEEPFLHEVIKTVNSINKLGCFLNFSDVPINKFKKLHASREEQELFYLIRGIRISHGDPLYEIMDELKKNEINDCLNISTPITSFSRKYEEKSKHSIKNINIVKYDGDDKIRLEWDDKYKTHLLILPDESELLITEPNKEKVFDFTDFEGKMVVNVEFKSFKFLESRDEFSVISLILFSYSLIHNIYKANFESIENNITLWDKLAHVVQLLQTNFLNYLTSDKFKIIKQVNAARETSASQERILSKFNEAIFDYISNEVTSLLKNDNTEINTPLFVGRFMLKIWIKDFDTVLKFKKKYNFKHNLYNGSSRTLQSFIKGLKNPTEHTRYKSLCHMVICELNTLDYEHLDQKYHKFRDIFVELCLSNLHFVKQMQNVMGENSLSIESHQEYLQTIKNYAV